VPDVAVVSVISSAAVGIAGLVTQAWTSHRTREHERELAQEQQEVEERRAAQDRSVELAEWCVKLAQALERPNKVILMSRGRPWDLDAKLTVHGPAVVLSALAHFDAIMETFMQEWIYPLLDIQRSVERATDAGDFEKAASIHAREVELRNEMASDLQDVKTALAAVQALLRRASCQSGPSPTGHE
jgi:hypothetical protein